MSALPKRYFTPEEYLLLEERSSYKSQWVDGEIFPMGEDTSGIPSMMGGAAPVHVRITTNLGASLSLRFRGRSCEAFTSDLRVASQPGGIYTYPDVAALCGEPRYDSSNPPSLLNPQVVVEVLSPSTAAFDRGEKFMRYKGLESLIDYVLVAANKIEVEHHARQPNGDWLTRTYDQPTDLLRLASVECEIPLAEIYDKVTFSAV